MIGRSSEMYEFDDGNGTIYQFPDPEEPCQG